MAGKGSSPRPVDGDKYRQGWERVFGPTSRGPVSCQDEAWAYVAPQPALTGAINRFTRKRLDEMRARLDGRFGGGTTTAFNATGTVCGSVTDGLPHPDSSPNLGDWCAGTQPARLPGDRHG